MLVSLCVQILLQQAGGHCDCNTPGSFGLQEYFSNVSTMLSNILPNVSRGQQKGRAHNSKQESVQLAGAHPRAIEIPKSYQKRKKTAELTRSTARSWPMCQCNNTVQANPTGSTTYFHQIFTRPRCSDGGNFIS